MVTRMKKVFSIKIVVNNNFFLYFLTNTFERSHFENFNRASHLKLTEADTQRCSWKKVFWKHAATLQENPCRSVISKRLLCNFIEITLRHGCSPVNLLHISRTRFTRNTSGRLLVNWVDSKHKAGFPLVDFFRTNGLFSPLMHHITQ